MCEFQLLVAKRLKPPYRLRDSASRSLMTVPDRDASWRPLLHLAKPGHHATSVVKAADPSERVVLKSTGSPN